MRSSAPATTRVGRIIWAGWPWPPRAKIPAAIVDTRDSGRDIGLDAMALIDINCDMGEGYGVYTLGDDTEMLKIVTSANIACGFHAGDPLVMHRTLKGAKDNGVGVGAHPGFLDLWGFGRRPIHGERPADIEKIILYQVGALMGLATDVGLRVRHVKTHGALGNLAAEDRDLAEAVARAVKTIDRNLMLVAMPGQEVEKAGEKVGLPLVREIYADRAYEDNGNLVSRKREGAVIHDADVAAENVIRMIGEARSSAGAARSCRRGSTASASMAI